MSYLVYGLVLDFVLCLVQRVVTASALWADAFYKSKCASVRPSVHLFVCSLLRYRLNVFLPPLPKVGCPIFLKVQNPWGKSYGKKWSQIGTFLFGSGLKSPNKKKSFYDKIEILQDCINQILNQNTFFFLRFNRCYMILVLYLNSIYKFSIIYRLRR